MILRIRNARNRHLEMPTEVMDISGRAVRPLSKEGLRDRLALAEGRLISSIRQRDELLAALRACAHFIENVTDDDVERTAKFFAVREAWRNAIAKTEGK